MWYFFTTYLLCIHKKIPLEQTGACSVVIPNQWFWKIKRVTKAAAYFLFAPGFVFLIDVWNMKNPFVWNHTQSRCFELVPDVVLHLTLQWSLIVFKITLICMLHLWQSSSTDYNNTWYYFYSIRSINLCIHFYIHI